MCCTVSKAEKVRKFGHEQLSVFGIGSELSANGWRSLARQLEASEALMRDPEHGGLLLGPAAKPILKGEASVALRVDADKPTRRERASRVSSPINDADAALFEALRAVRRSLASEAGVPPYVIFHDATLHAMAAARPQSLAALGQISGVGARKLEAYGAAFLGVLRD